MEYIRKSFSIKPSDNDSKNSLILLEKYASRHGINISKLIVDGIKLKVKELGLDD